VCQGDTGAVAAVAPGTSLQVNLSGEDVFGVQDPLDPTNGNLFQVLDLLVSDLRAGNVTNARDGLTRVQSAVERITLAESKIGARGRQLEAIEARNGDLAIQLKSELSEVEDVDYAKALIDVQAQHRYRVPVLAAKIIQPSLLNLR
jgi:flagellar hook-associated protein 3 FlgL